MGCHEIEEATDADRRLRRPGRILSLLAAGLFWLSPAEAQRLAGDHLIEWIGGVPDASFEPRHEDGQQPTIPEPAGMNRERWDALVFDAFDEPEGGFEPRRPLIGQTIVLERAVVPTIRICIQSPDTSKTGERLAPYSDASWWRRNIARWTGLSWNGEIRIAACTNGPQTGWVHVRAGRSGELAGDTLAHAASQFEGHPHKAGRWVRSEIVWNPDTLQEMDESSFEKTLAHELGHVLGFSHVAPESRYIMSYHPDPVWSEEESSYAQLAYRVGPNIRFPGLVRDGVQASPDRATLMALYNATNGNNWTNNTVWGTDEPLDHWHGVRTDAAGRVVYLNLHDNNLTGPLPSSMTNLQGPLEYLQIQNNDGLCAPEDAAFQTWLKERVFVFNGETCEEPPEPTGPTGPTAPNDRAVLTALYHATGGPNWRRKKNWLSSEALRFWAGVNATAPPRDPETGRPVGDGRVSALRLRGNNLTGSIPASLGSLSSLGSLDLRGNSLTSIPPELGALTNLMHLRLSRNNLTGPLPLSMTNLRRLNLLILGSGLCVPADAVFQAWVETIDYFYGNTCAEQPEDEVQPKAPDEVQANVDAAVAAGGGLRAGGPPVTIAMSTLFSFGDGGSADTTFTARSSRPALVTADTTDGSLVLTPGDPQPARSPSNLARGAADALERDPERVTITVTATRADDTAEVEFTVEIEPEPPPEPESFSIPNLGGWSITSNGTETTTQVGYGRIRAAAGSTTPSGIAIFQFRDSEGVLISEAGVPASEPVQEGRIFAEVNGPVNTGLAIANPNDVPATINF